MSVGLPGLGLGGLFFILSALLAPLVELTRLLRGRSSLAAWRHVGRQFAIAVTMIAAVDLALRLVYAALELTTVAEPPDASGLTVLPLVPIAITATLLATVLAGAKAAQLAATMRLRGLPPLVVGRLPGRARVLATGAALTAAWAVLLALGTAQLTPVSSGDDAERPEALAGPAEIGLGEAAAEGAGERRGFRRGFVGTGPGPEATRPGAASGGRTGTGRDGGAATVSPSPSNAEVGAAGDGAVQAPAPTGQSAEAPPEETVGQGQATTPAGTGPPDDPGPPEHANGGQADPPAQPGPPEHAGTRGASAATRDDR